MKILIIEPYFTGSHKSWLNGFKKNSSHSIRIITMKGQFWKWRMHGGAITLAHKFNSMNYIPDLIIATDMLDLPNFISLTRKKISRIPIVLYFHENQITYPWSKTDRDYLVNRDKHYGFINYASALSADNILFNSKFHMNSFLMELPRFLKQFPDYTEIQTVETIKNKSQVLHLGMDLRSFDKIKIKKKKKNNPIILWNHRWEYDKNPESFFHLLYRLDKEGFPFEIAILGESFKTKPSIFDEAKDKLNDRIVHYGYCDHFKDYAQWLWKADILPVTSNQDFFGISIMEGIYCCAYPILPRRLAYPELLPESYHSNHLYDSEDDLYEMVKGCMQDITMVREHSMGDWIRKFDWNTMAPSYDKLFNSYI